jgi:hypothetical protein
MTNRFWLALLTLVTVTLSASAAQVAGLTVFTAGTPAKAAEVNANFSALAAAIAAADGVTEINQEKALAGSVTPGDAAGFPITISESGSYRLSSNLTVPFITNAFEIASDGVTLDLNGFSVVGDGTCADSSGFTAVLAETGATTQITLRNGIIRGFCFGIRFGAATDATIEDMHIATTGNGALYTGTNAIVRRNHLSGPNSGINCPSIVVDTSFVGSSGNNGILTTSCAKANLIGTF